LPIRSSKERNVKKERSTHSIIVPDQLEELHWSQQQELQHGIYLDSPQRYPMSFNHAKKMKGGTTIISSANIL
jgi:hypothetical protein